MKKFIKYKGFLPPRYVDEKISKNKKNNKKAIWMLVILNFYMLPVNFRNVLKETNDEKIVNITYYNENEKLQYTKKRCFNNEMYRNYRSNGTGSCKNQGKNAGCHNYIQSPYGFL